MKFFYYIIFLVVIAFIFLFILTQIQAHNIKKKDLPIDRLKKSERQLFQFKEFNTIQRFENYEILRKAISRLHSILSQIDGINYEKQEILNWDYLHSDVYIIPYFNCENQLSYISYIEAQSLPLPSGNYEVIDFSVGKYIQNGVEKISTRLAIDNYLLVICNRWIDELNEIENAISEIKQAES